MSNFTIWSIPSTYNLLYLKTSVLYGSGAAYNRASNYKSYIDILNVHTKLWGNHTSSH